MSRLRIMAAGPWVLAPALAGLLALGAQMALAEMTESPHPKPRPPSFDETVVAPPAIDPALDNGAVIEDMPPDALPPEDGATATSEAQATAKPARVPRDPTKGAVTNLPIPRYVSLKGGEGNARRGPGLTHRIDWVFTTSGMPLRITAEHENWRKVEDAEGLGGWVHYSLLSGVRSVLVTADMAEFRSKPLLTAQVEFQAEKGVIGRLLECEPDWCRINVQGEKGWVQKASLWGADPGELVE